MKKYRDMKISAKLILGFILVALIAAIVGILGAYFTSTIKKADMKLYEENTLGVSNVADANVAYQRIRFTAVKMLLDTSLTKEGTDSINTYVATIDDALSKYQSRDFTDEDKALYDTMQDDWKVYQTELQKFLDAMAKEDTKTANDLVFGDLFDAGNNLQDASDALFQYNIDAAKERSSSNDKMADQALYFMIVAIAAGVILAIILGTVISKAISGPVNKMVEAADKLTIGDVDVNIDVNSKDEIGKLAESLKAMIVNIRAQAKAAERIAMGDLTVKVAVRSDKDLLGQKLYELVEKNNEVLSNISIASEQVAAGSKQVSDSSIALSQGATEQASSIEELTASLEEISSQTKLNAQNANQANELAEVAKNTAVEGNSQMKAMQDAMDEINVSSANISKIIKVIDEIAFQTNILALNAAVEAARAGQHGKGFAVVAEEVRTLAARSANAAKETTDMIEGSITKVEAGTKIANDTAQALTKIVADVAKAATLVADIATASNEQATGIAQINQGIMQVSQVVQTNSATAEESAAASEELSSQAELLRESVGKFKLRTERYSTSSKFDELTPEVKKMLEGMNDKLETGNDTGYVKKMEDSVAKSKIILSDSDFGKY